jgi:RNA polymerase sigma-54 factor
VKASLQLRVGHGLSMTPQLQQSIRLLQLSSIELQAEIQEALEENPLLEIEENFDYINTSNQQEEEGDGSENSPLEIENIPTELQTDSEWEDTFENQRTTSASHSQTISSDIIRDDEDESGQSLQEHLLWQMRLTPFSELEQLIAIHIIDAIEDDGYFKGSLEDIGLSLGGDYDVNLDEIELVLHRLQHFDPIGVGSRDLRECLLTQLHLFEHNNSEQTELLTVLIDQYLDVLANRDYRQIKSALKITDEELTELVELIQLLKPRPGYQIQVDKTEYIAPDVYVRKLNNRWQLSLNVDNTPKLKVAEHYAQLIKRADNSTDNVYLKNHLQEARWFIKNLQSRNDTLLKVTEAIINRQKGFLEYGDEALRPLILQNIAEEVEMHESTISRITTRKYLHTPRGIFELKYFFSSHVNTDSGGECSATAIRAIIKKIVHAENIRKPLSDSKIADILGEKGIKVARRTIAKYRESLAIPPSNIRKRLV